MPGEGSKEYEVENVDAIKKFIEAQEKEIQEQKLADQLSETTNDVTDNKPSREETMSVASSVIDMIISESELEIAKKHDVKSKEIFSPGDRGRKTYP